MLGEPEELRAVAHLSDRGIDLDVAVAGRYAGGATAALTASMTSHSPRSATVATDQGLFDLGSNFHHPAQLRWIPDSGRDPDGAAAAGVVVPPDEPVIGVGYGNEVVEVHRCLREGRTTSAVVPPEQTVSLMRQMDDVREQIGVRFR